MHQALARQGIRIGKKRVERLMRDAQLVGRAATLYRRVPGMARFFSRHENLRLNAPEPEGVDQQWVADVTYIKVNGRWSFLAAVMDVYSRRIIGWSLSSSRTVELTMSALRHALRVRRPKSGLIFHSDRGSEYAAHVFQHELARHGIRTSMNRPGCCTDNGHMESFFHTAKAELIHGTEFKDEQELRLALAGYINQFYNRSRLHSALGYLSPKEYEEMAA